MRQRVLTACLLIPPVLLAVFLSNPWPLWGLAVIALLVGFQEIRRLAGLQGVGVPILGLLLILSTIWVHNLPLEQAPPRALGLGFALALAPYLVGVLAAVAIANGRRGLLIADLAGLWLATPLWCISFLSLVSYRSTTFHWSTPILLCLIPLWVGDTLAIFAGRAFGKHLLAPKISPKKTVEGGIANLVGCLGAAVGLTYLIGQPLLVGILAGTATGVLGQLGDLLESAMKRSADLKDSGNLLPGHGGLLDRIDSILLSAPVVAVIIAYYGVL